MRLNIVLGQTREPLGVADSSREHVDRTRRGSLRRLMTEVVGSGHKSADDMTRSQARQAMGRILDGDPPETTLGAFLLANRWKRNTPEELAAFTDVMRDRGIDAVAPAADPVDCGANYDGKHTAALLGVAAGLSAARDAIADGSANDRLTALREF